MKIEKIDWPFSPLKPLSYEVIMADPPWSFSTWSDAGLGKSAQVHYDCMSIADIMRLPVSQLARGDCWLWLWATHPMLPQALEVMRAWGFEFVTSGVWCKRRDTESPLAFGTGYVLRSASEPFLIGRIGKPRIAARNVRTVIDAPRREHSRKPDAAYLAAEQLFGNCYKCELFAREQRDGWDVWGNEVDKF